MRNPAMFSITGLHIYVHKIILPLRNLPGHATAPTYWKTILLPRAVVTPKNRKVQLNQKQKIRIVHNNIKRKSLSRHDMQKNFQKTLGWAGREQGCAKSFFVVNDLQKPLDVC